MEAHTKNYDRFSNTPVLNEKGEPTVALMVDRQPLILKALADHNQLAVEDIHAIVGGNRRSLYETLRILKAKPNEYIRLVPEQQRTRNLRTHLCYQLAPNGVRWLNEHGRKTAPPRRSYSLSHDTLTSHVTASLTTGIAASTDARFVPADEIQDHPKFPAEERGKSWTIPHPRKNWIKPDSPLFAIELKDGERKPMRFYFLEVDNGTSDKGETIWPENPPTYDGSSLYEKLEAYVPFIEERRYREKWGIPNLYILFVFRDASRMKRTMEKFATIDTSRFIAFQLADPTAAPGYLFKRPWQRVGFPPLYLNQP